MSIGIAVFGSSEPSPEDALYLQAHEVGRRLAVADFRVLTGGYGGVMEGASRGAMEAGGETLGVTCKIFSHRAPNPYLTETVDSADLHDRTRQLIDRAQGFVVLEGKAGTLSELTFLWALKRTGCLGERPVILLGERWKGLVAGLIDGGLLEPPLLETTRLVADPRAAVREIQSCFPGPDPASGPGPDQE